MNDAVDHVIMERQALDRGFGGSLALSFFAHAFFASLVAAAAFLLPREPVIQVANGFVVTPLPKGGGGTPNPEPPAPAPAPVKEEPAKDEPPAPVAPERPKILKPPKEERNPKAIPELDSKRHKPKETPTPPPVGRSHGTSHTASTGTAGGTGTSSQTPGLSVGPPGVGAPNGVDAGGDWYMATVQQKIWMVWTQQLNNNVDFKQSIGVEFTIMADGRVEDIKVTEPSPSALLNLAAQRAVSLASPFAPLPKTYGTNQYTVHAIFQPTS